VTHSKHIQEHRPQLQVPVQAYLAHGLRFTLYTFLSERARSMQIPVCTTFWGKTSVFPNRKPLHRFWL